MNLFKYTIISEYDEEKEKKIIDYIAHYPYGERGFEPRDTDSENVFSSKEKAIENAKKRILNEEIGNSHLIVIESLGLDVEENDESFESDITIINLHNNKEYNFSWFNEYEHNDLLYKKGDWVYFYSNQRLQIGLISAEAEGEEPYLIISENNCLSDGHTHEHVSEMWIIKKMDKKEVEKILPYKFLSNIEVRAKLYNLEKKERQKKKEEKQ